MTDKTGGELADELWEKVMERMPPGGTHEDVTRIVKDIILGDDEIDEDEGGER